MAVKTRHDVAEVQAGPGAGAEQCNEVLLVGRLAAAAVERALPSGDHLVSFRLVVPRAPAGPGRATRPTGPTVDTVDCSAWSARMRRQVLSWEPGDLVEARGALRRRFWRSPTGGAVSRYEVEVHQARRRRRATMAG